MSAAIIDGLSEGLRRLNLIVAAITMLMAVSLAAYLVFYHGRSRAARAFAALLALLTWISLGDLFLSTARLEAAHPAAAFWLRFQWLGIAMSSTLESDFTTRSMSCAIVPMRATPLAESSLPRTTRCKSPSTVAADELTSSSSPSPPPCSSWRLAAAWLTLARARSAMPWKPVHTSTTWVST